MGSWNETCAMSHLPIHAGDKVMWLMLTEGRYIYDSEYGGRSSGIYPDTFWVPRNIPIVGIYDDYGRIEKEETGILRDMAVDAFQVDMVDGPQTPRLEISGTPAPAKKNLSFANLLEWLGEGLVEIDHNAVERQEDLDRVAQRREIDRLLKKFGENANDPMWKDQAKARAKGYAQDVRRAKNLPVVKAPVIQIMILKDVWDHLCAMPSSQEGGGWFTPGILKEHVAELVAEIREDGERWRVAFAEDPIKASESHAFGQPGWRDAPLEPEKCTNPGLALLKQEFNFIERDGGGPWTASPGRQVRLAQERLYDGTMTAEDAVLVFERAVEFFAVRMHVHNLRITWGPTTGSGGQHSCLDEHLMFAKFVARYAYNTERLRLVRQQYSTRDKLTKYPKNKKTYEKDLAELEEQIEFIDSVFLAPKGRGAGKGRKSTKR